MSLRSDDWTFIINEKRGFVKGAIQSAILSLIALLMLAVSCATSAARLSISIDRLGDHRERLRQGTLLFLACALTDGAPEYEAALEELSSLDLGIASDRDRSIQLYRVLLRDLDPNPLTLKNEFFEADSLSPPELEIRLDQMELLGAAHSQAGHVVNYLDDLGRDIALLGEFEVDPTESSVNCISGKFESTGIHSAYSRKRSSGRTLWERDIAPIHFERERYAKSRLSERRLTEYARSRQFRDLAERGTQVVRAVSYTPLDVRSVRFVPPLTVPGPGHDINDESFFIDPWTSYCLISTTFVEHSPFLQKDSSGSRIAKIRHSYSLSTPQYSIEADTGMYSIPIVEDESLILLTEKSSWFHKTSQDMPSVDRVYLFGRRIEAPDGRVVDDISIVALPQNTPLIPFYQAALVEDSIANPNNIYNLPVQRVTSTLRRTDTVSVWFPVTNLPYSGDEYRALVNYVFVPQREVSATARIDMESIRAYLSEAPPMIEENAGTESNPQGYLICSKYPNAYRVMPILVPPNCESHRDYSLLIAVRGGDGRLICSSHIDGIRVE